mgnify:CR=1 FL=1
MSTPFTNTTLELPDLPVNKYCRFVKRTHIATTYVIKIRDFFQYESSATLKDLDTFPNIFNVNPNAKNQRKRKKNKPKKKENKENGNNNNNNEQNEQNHNNEINNVNNNTLKAIDKIAGDDAYPPSPAPSKSPPRVNERSAEKITLRVYTHNVNGLRDETKLEFIPRIMKKKTSMHI